MDSRRSERRAALAMTLATLLWGATFVVLRDILDRVPPASLVVTRFAAAALVLGAVLLVRRRVPRRADLVGGVLTGVLTAGGYLFQAVGLETASAGTSAFLTCTGTLLAAAFAWPLLGQRPGRWLALGLVVAMVGSALLSLRGGLRVGVGEAWTLAGAVVFALQIVALSRFARGSDARALAMTQAATVALVVWPFAGFPRLALPPLDGADLARLGYLALAGSVVAPMLQIVAQRALPPGRVGLLFALEPVFALAFALSIGGERFVARWWAGAALILIAVLVVEGQAARAEAARPASA
jgi:drug/metabolite transporter (DMT)-like permease